MRFIVAARTLALTALVCAPTALHAQTARPSRAPEPVARVDAPLVRLDGPSAFTGLETVLDFEAFAEGTQITDQYAPLATFELYEGGAPEIWSDGASPRSGEPLGDLALVNAVESGAELHGALAIELPGGVSRAGFEIRGAEGEALNLLLSALRNGVEVDTLFFDVATDFGFVGVECLVPFDALVVHTTNPSGAGFSVDNLRFELDLADDDADGVPNFGDVCPNLFNPRQRDRDGDGTGDACDAFPLDPQDDADGDGFAAQLDNCPEAYNPDQLDGDGDGLGDACDLLVGADTDGDGVADDADNCPLTPNPGQEDCDGDGVGDTCDLTLVDPSAVSFTLNPGECVDVTKEICLPSVAPVVDVLISVDRTGSMGGEINLLKGEILQFIADLRFLAGSNMRFGLVAYRDYPGVYSSCGYSSTYGSSSDSPFDVLAPIGSTDAEVVAGVNTLFAGGGADLPESYTRVLWEVSQPDSGIDFRPGAARIVVDFQDDIPHDCFVDEGLFCPGLPTTTGWDPGRDEVVFTADDLDLHLDALFDLLATTTKLFAIHSGTNAAKFCAWQGFTDITQGNAILINPNGTLPPGLDLAEEVFDSITDELVFEVSLITDPFAVCELDISFDPEVASGPFMDGDMVTITETICVPADLPEGDYFCLVVALADDVAIGIQTVDIMVGPCRTLGFEGAFPNGHEVTPADFLASGVTISSSGLNNFGAAIFDSGPAGPNAFGPDPDLLVGTGNLLILQENQPQAVPGTFDVPDDAQLGGAFLFDFDGPVELLSIDLVDIDLPPPSQTVTLTLFDGSGRLRTYVVPDGWTTDVFNDGPPGFGTLDLTTLLPQPGDSSSATAMEDVGFDPLDVVALQVHMQSSGALDNLSYCPAD